MSQDPRDFPRPRGADRPAGSPHVSSGEPWPRHSRQSGKLDEINAAAVRHMEPTGEPEPVLYSVDDLREDTRPRVPTFRVAVIVAIRVAIAVVAFAAFVIVVHWLNGGRPV